MKTLVLALATLLVWLTSVCAGPLKPADRAKKLIDAQVAALDKADDVIVGTFSQDALALVPQPRELKNPNIGLRAAIARTSPHDWVKGIKIGKLVAGGDDNAVWLSAELAITRASHEPGEKFQTITSTVRVTELITADAGWKAVAAAIAEPGAPSSMKEPPAPLPGATDPGPLAALVASPTALDAALSKDMATTVFGTEKAERAYGPTDAHALLKKWSKLKLQLDGKPVEVRGPTIGYVTAQVSFMAKDDPYPSRMAVLLIAVPTIDGKWSVVAVQYTPL